MIPMLADTATAAMTAGSDGMVDQCSSAVTATDTPRPGKIPTTPPAN